MMVNIDLLDLTLLIKAHGYDTLTSEVVGEYLYDGNEEDVSEFIRKILPNYVKCFETEKEAREYAEIHLSFEDNWYISEYDYGYLLKWNS